MNKIFGIGLSRTGTSSLNEALEMIGYRSIHFPIIMENTSTRAKLKYRLNKWGKELGRTEPFFKEFSSGTGNSLTFKKPNEKEFDAMTDLSVARFYRELDMAFPKSKFILTIRNEEVWLRSCRKFFAQGNHQFFKWLQVNIDMYKTPFYNEKLYGEAYREHIKGVTTYFENRPDDLLIIDITKGDGWEQLCPFLEVKIPAQSFPFKNAAT